LSFGPLVDPVAATAAAALDGVAARQAVHADNLANSATPHFIARKVVFEESLAASLADTGRPDGMQIATVTAPGPANSEGNTVDVAAETMALDKAQLAYDSLVAIHSFRHRILAEGLAR